jgi:toxin ParE1/3/4
VQIRLTVQARRDLSDIWMYVARDGSDRADGVLDRIGRQFRLIAAYPLIGRVRPEIARQMRALAVERWLILYLVQQDAVVVSRVIDSARNLSRLAKPRR